MQKEKNQKNLAEKFLKHGLRITPQRSLIFEELSNAKNHPTADAIYRRVRRKMPNISFDTVYRTLLSFAEKEMVSLVEGYGEQKRFEPNVNHHHHCRCVKCHAIIDFSNDLYDSIKIPEAISKEFQVLNKRVVLEGICSKCKRK
ncbi:MAG: transcriptional repressor [Endomicrobiaceae bacterium]|nr:transcriptional repressor [Endomicrobiaceae bacterium]